MKENMVNNLKIETCTPWDNERSNTVSSASSLDLGTCFTRVDYWEQTLCPETIINKGALLINYT